MPILQNPDHEAFARARAAGATLYEAYEDAGYAPSRAHGLSEWAEINRKWKRRHG